MPDDDKKRVKDEHHDHVDKKWQLSEEMNEFTAKLTEKFPELRITSGKREGSGKSHHHTGDAIDIGKEHANVYDYLMNTKEGLSLMGQFGLGVIDETDPVMMAKTGATGPHFHIGKDTHYASQTNARLNRFDEYYTFPSREDAKYKKDESGKWMINLGEGTKGQYVPIATDYESRAAALDKMAQKVMVEPEKVYAFNASNPAYDHNKSTTTVAEDGTVTIDSPVPFQLVEGAPVPIQNFMADLAKEKEKSEIKEKKTKESEARKRIEEAKAIKAKKREQFIEELSKMNTDDQLKEAQPNRQREQLRYQKTDMDFQDQQRLPELPSIFQIPQQ